MGGKRKVQKSSSSCWLCPWFLETTTPQKNGPVPYKTKTLLLWTRTLRFPLLWQLPGKKVLCPRPSTPLIIIVFGLIIRFELILLIGSSGTLHSRPSPTPFFHSTNSLNPILQSIFLQKFLYTLAFSNSPILCHYNLPLFAKSLPLLSS